MPDIVPCNCSPTKW